MTLDNKELVRIGGRKSQLAVVQSEIVKNELETAHENIECSILALSTFGDKHRDQALYSFGGKALWTKELEVLLLGDVGEFKQLDLVVHCLKDVPTKLPEEFELGCILKRADPRDALIMKKGSSYKSLADLPEGSVVGTSSIRRSAQLLKNYPHLKFESVRGNLQTRIRKLDEDNQFECILLAAAGLIRTDLDHRITKYLDEDEMYYSVGQGALGVEIRKGDTRIKQLLQRVEDKNTTYCCLAERSLMRYLEGGCSVPLGVRSNFDNDSNILTLKAIIVSPDGTESVQADIEKEVSSHDDCEQLGIELGDLLVERGAKTILDSIDYQRINERPTRSESQPVA